MDFPPFSMPEIIDSRKKSGRMKKTWKNLSVRGKMKKQKEHAGRKR